MEGTTCIMAEVWTSNVPQGQGWKGQPACGCFSCHQKVLWSILRKKQEELGGVVGILDCFVLVHIVYQLPIIG